MPWYRWRSRSRGEPADSGSPGDADEPDRDYDRSCKSRYMHYYLEEAQTAAADNDTLEGDRLDIMAALTLGRDVSREGEDQERRLFVKSVTAIARFLGYRNALGDRVTWGQAALAAAELLKDDLAIAELCASTISWPLLQQGRNEEARSYCERGLEAARSSGDSAAAHRWAGNAARTLSGIARDSKDPATAYHWAEQAAMHAQACGDQTLIRGAELDFGYAALLRGDFPEAEKKFRGLLDLEERGHDDERIGNRAGDVSLAIMNRAVQSGDSTERARLCEQAGALVEYNMRLGRQINHAVMIAEGEISLGVLARIRGQEDEYQRLAGSGRRRFAELGIRRPGRAEQFVVFPDTQAGLPSQIQPRPPDDGP
jgi:tetratricopeptide (TPR) repeat protein